MRYLLILLLFTGCITEKKARHWLDHHQEVAAPYCAERYPAQDFIDTLWLEPNTDQYNALFMELWQYIDTLRSQQGSIEYRDSIRTMYRDRWRVVTRERIIHKTTIDSAKVQALRIEIDKLNQQLTLTQQVANAKITKILGIALATIAALAYQIRRFMRKTK